VQKELFLIVNRRGRLIASTNLVEDNKSSIR